MFRRSLLFLALAVAPAHAQELWLPSLFSDHMVLQRNDHVPFWGRAPAGATVEVQVPWGANVRDEADEKGRFEIRVETLRGPGPYEVSVVCGDQKRTFKDVLLGEVWVCGGQSNMEWPLSRAKGGEFYAKAAHLPQIRFFNVPNIAKASPQRDCDGEWVKCSPDTASRFSAVAFFFASAMHERVNGAPMGMITSDWGGTPAESWTARDELRRLGDFDQQLAEIDELRKNPKELDARHAKALDDWRLVFDKAEPGSPTRGAWHTGKGDEAEWQKAQLPGNWESTSLGKFDGTVWYRREVEIPAAWNGKGVKVELGPVDDNDVTWLDGQEIGSTENWREPRSYSVDADKIRAGKHSIVVRVHDTGGGGGFHGRPEQMRVVCETGESIPLAGEWLFRRGAKNGDLPRPPRRPGVGPRTPSALYNGMIAPLMPYANRGFLFYQGESNVARAAQYRRLLPALIRSWRRGWSRGYLPFYMVQIAPFAYRDDRGQAAELREAQMQVMQTVPNTGMVVTTDIGNPKDIHPADKRTVGERLSLWAINKSYSIRAIRCCGPIYKAMNVEGGRIRISFDHTEGQPLRPGKRGLDYFTIAGEDRVFHPAKAVIDGDEILVSSEEVPKPVAVRFAWGAADEPDLMSRWNLPASPFRTDDWPKVSADR